MKFPTSSPQENQTPYDLDKFLRTFKVGDIINERRSDGRIQDDWEILSIDTENKVLSAKRTNPEPGGLHARHNNIPFERVAELNPDKFIENKPRIAKLRERFSSALRGLKAPTPPESFPKMYIHNADTMPISKVEKSENSWIRQNLKYYKPIKVERADGSIEDDWKPISINYETRRVFVELIYTNSRGSKKAINKDIPFAEIIKHNS